MIVAFDASILIYVFDPQANAPNNPITGKPVDRCHERVNHLLATLQQQDAKIIIPAPALAEVLVRISTGVPDLLRILHTNKYFRIAAFDERAAIEFAVSQADRLKSGNRHGSSSRTKVKFDDQIVAIAAVENVTIIYSDDGDISNLAKGRFEVVGIGDIPLPPQGELDL